jgi:hypothetical protein
MAPSEIEFSIPMEIFNIIYQVLCLSSNAAISLICYTFFPLLIKKNKDKKAMYHSHATKRFPNVQNAAIKLNIEPLFFLG